MIKSILDEISAEASTNQKMNILDKYKDNKLLRRVLYLAESKRIKFYIKQIPEYQTNSISTLDLIQAVDNLIYIINRVYRGNEAIEYLRNMLSSLSAEDAYVIERIITKDLKIGMGDTNINKVLPKLIETTPYMGAKAFDPAKAREMFANGKKCFCDVKMDGRYNNVIIRDGEVECESRQGETVILTGAKFLKELSHLPDCVLNGELTIDNEPNRYKANGIVTSLIDIMGKYESRTAKENDKKISAFENENDCKVPEMLDRLVYTVRDAITVDEYYDNKSDVPYYTRWENVLNLLLQTTMVRPVEKEIVNSYDEALIFFQNCLERGLEGSILKAYDGKWKDGKPTYQQKMKLEIEMDLFITGFNWGTKGTKNENVISSLICESSDGLLKTNPGGMDEKTMKFVTNNMNSLLNSIVNIKCSGISFDRDGNFSLLHPRIGDQRFRTDKTEADSLEQIKAIEIMAKGLS
jgi:hypothetical protein